MGPHARGNWWLGSGMFRSSGKSPNKSDSWSLSPHGEVRTQILAPSAAALDSGRVHGANRPNEGFPPPSLKGRCSKAIWRHMTLSERLGSCVIGRMVGRSMPWCAHGSGGRVPPPSSSTSPVLCVDVRASGLSEAETGSEPKVRPANACWPAFSLPDWRLLSPAVLGEGSLGRLGGGRWVSLGRHAPRPQRLQDGSRSAKDGRCETRGCNAGHTNGGEEGPLTMPWTSQPPGPGGTHRT